MSLSRRDAGRWVRIRFWDHCITNVRRGTKKPIQCEVSGMILTANDLKVVLATWTITGEDRPTRETNAERFEIVRKAIIDYGWAEILKWHRD